MVIAPDSSPDARVIRTRNDILSTALTILSDEGQDALTHPHLARVAGYSRATVYKHWPTRADLLREAFEWLHDMPHSTPGGDVRADLIAELTMFRTAIRVHRVDRLLSVLADLAVSSEEMAGIRNRMVDDGEAVVRSVLARVTQGSALEAAALMLTGFVINAAMLHDGPPDDDLIAAAVDLTLDGIRSSP